MSETESKGRAKEGRIGWMLWTQPALWVVALVIGLVQGHAYLSAFAGYGLAVAVERLFEALDVQAGIRGASLFRDAWDAEEARIKAKGR